MKLSKIVENTDEVISDLKKLKNELLEISKHPNIIKEKVNKKGKMSKDELKEYFMDKKTAEYNAFLLALKNSNYVYDQSRIEIFHSREHDIDLKSRFSKENLKLNQGEELDIEVKVKGVKNFKKIIVWIALRDENTGTTDIRRLSPSGGKDKFFYRYRADKAKDFTSDKGIEYFVKVIKDEDANNFVFTKFDKEKSGEKTEKCQICGEDVSGDVEICSNCGMIKKQIKKQVDNGSKMIRTKDEFYHIIMDQSDKELIIENIFSNLMIEDPYKYFANKKSDKILNFEQIDINSLEDKLIKKMKEEKEEFKKDNKEDFKRLSKDNIDDWLGNSKANFDNWLTNLISSFFEKEYSFTLDKNCAERMLLRVKNESDDIKNIVEELQNFKQKQLIRRGRIKTKLISEYFKRIEPLITPNKKSIVDYSVKMERKNDMNFVGEVKKESITGSIKEKIQDKKLPLLMNITFISTDDPNSLAGDIKKVMEKYRNKAEEILLINIIKSLDDDFKRKLSTQIKDLKKIPNKTIIFYSIEENKIQWYPSQKDMLPYYYNYLKKDGPIGLDEYMRKISSLDTIDVEEIKELIGIGENEAEKIINEIKDLDIEKEISKAKERVLGDIEVDDDVDMALPEDKEDWKNILAKDDKNEIEEFFHHLGKDIYKEHKINNSVESLIHLLYSKEEHRNNFMIFAEYFNEQYIFKKFDAYSIPANTPNYYVSGIYLLSLIFADKEASVLGNSERYFESYGLNIYNDMREKSKYNNLPEIQKSIKEEGIVHYEMKKE